MRLLSWSGRSVVVLAAVLAAVVVGGVAYAADTGALSSSPARLYACAAKSSEQLSLSSARGKCRKGARKVAWNASGVQGPSGVAGLQGSPGAAGVAGPAGATGSTGPSGATGVTGTAGVAGVGLDALFGDASDGSVTIGSNTTLTRDMYYANLTVSPGVTLNPGGFRIFVAGTLTLGSGSSIARNGNSAAAGTPGAALSPGTLGAGAAGGYGGSGASETNSLGGSGGGGGAAGTATSPVAGAGGAGVFRSPVQALTGHSLDGAIVNGGAGGGTALGGASAGGGGGGVVVVAARTVVLSSGSAAITANGGNGAVDNPSETGYGGGGGIVVVISTTSQPAGVTLSATGGTDVPSGGSGESGFTDWLS
jgi:hypothetical protein